MAAMGTGSLDGADARAGAELPDGEAEAGDEEPDAGEVNDWHRQEHHGHDEAEPDGLEGGERARAQGGLGEGGGGGRGGAAGPGNET